MEILKHFDNLKFFVYVIKEFRMKRNLKIFQGSLKYFKI